MSWNCHGHWYGENADPRFGYDTIFWASYQGTRSDDTTATRSSIFQIDKGTGIATNYVPFIYYSDLGGGWWNKPSD